MAGGFLAQMRALAELRRAWLRVCANGGKPGGDGISLATFAARLESELAQLRREVAAGKYRPRPMLGLTIVKSGGGRRELAIPSVRDRVLQTAFAQALSPILEPQFEPCSYAYRPGRSIRMAAEAVLCAHRAGLIWTVDADIDQFFDNITHSRLLECLRPFLSDTGALGLLQSWLGADLLKFGELRRLIRGLPQGSPLSPLLSNLYMDAFDESLEAQGQTLIRYADDFVLLCRGREDARRGLQSARLALASLDLSLNEEKTRIANFQSGLDFLGVHFVEPTNGGPLLATSPHPALLPAYRLETVMHENETLPKEETGLLNDTATTDTAEPVEPLLRSLYVTGHGSRLGIAGERFVVKPLDEDEHEVPALKVDQIILFGHVQASTQALHYCFKHGIPVLFASVGGELHGLLNVCGNRFTQRQRLQFIAAEDAAFTLETARAMVLGKIANSRTVLQRYARRHLGETVGEQIEALSPLVQHAQSASDLDQLRGFEGSAAKVYFDGWRGLLPPQWAFGNREKHPATEPVNSLLNLGYSLLYQNLRTLLVAEGLNPALGFLHACSDGHAALASDVMEEFRAVVVDTLVFGDLLGGKGFHPDDFTLDADAEWPCSIKRDPLHRFLGKFEAKMNSPFTHPDEPAQLDFRRVMQRQCRHLTETIAERGGYRPLRIR